MSSTASSSGHGAGGLRRPGAMRGKLKAPKRIGLELSPDEMWSRLSNAISQIQNHNVSTLSYEEHYRYAYNMILINQGKMLYEGIERRIKEHLQRQCEQVLVPAFPPGGISSVSADIILPHSLSTSKTATSSTTTDGLSRSKGKEKAISQDAAPEETTIANVTSAGAGDQTDAAARGQNAERLLKAMKDVWEEHCSCMARIREVLKYVDRVYVQHNHVLPVWELGLELFRDHVVSSRLVPVATHLYSALLTQIQLERHGQVINRSVVKANVDMLIALTHPKPGALIAARPTVYKYVFEPAFLATSAAFYKNEADRLLETSDAKSYLRHVERRLIEEEGRVAVFLAPTTDQPLRAILERDLLAGHLQTILDMPGSGLANMLESDLKDDLKRVYKLFWRVQNAGPLVLKNGLKSFITRKGKEINAGLAASATNEDAAPAANGDATAKGDAAAATSPQATLALKWVEDVLTFKTEFDDILKTSFDSDKSVETVLNEAFESFINVNPRAPEFISLFIDENLKKGLKGKTEQEVEEILNRTIVVFRFLHEKDIFERYYKTHLAKRLLQGRSVSDDAERGMMAKLKIECGHGYVQKLQGMLNDMKVSEDTNTTFAEHVKKSEKSMPFDLSVSVLTSTYWPVAAQVQPCTMPPAMLAARQAFESFYSSRHSGRLLNWHPNLGSADLRVTFKNRKHELNLSTFALVVLMLFQDEDGALSYPTIKQSTEIPEGELKRTLQALACAKYKILLKEPKGREITDKDKFTFNQNFSCPLARIKIPVIAARVESTQERKETNTRVEEERNISTEAAIVRVMKDRKTLGHNELLNEVIKQLSGRFQPQPVLVKKRIESLIDREYLERSSEGINVYNYLA